MTHEELEDELDTLCLDALEAIAGFIAATKPYADLRIPRPEHIKHLLRFHSLMMRKNLLRRKYYETDIRTNLHGPSQSSIPEIDVCKIASRYRDHK